MRYPSLSILNGVTDVNAPQVQQWLGEAVDYQAESISLSVDAAELDDTEIAAYVLRGEYPESQNEWLYEITDNAAREIIGEILAELYENQTGRDFDEEENELYETILSGECEYWEWVHETGWEIYERCETPVDKALKMQDCILRIRVGAFTNDGDHGEVDQLAQDLGEHPETIANLLETVDLAHEASHVVYAYIETTPSKAREMMDGRHGELAAIMAPSAVVSLEDSINGAGATFDLANVCIPVGGGIGMNIGHTPTFTALWG